MSNLSHCIYAVFSQPFGNAPSYAPEVCQRPVIPKGVPVIVFVKDSYTPLGMLSCNIKSHLSQIQVCTYAAGGSNFFLSQDFIHYSLRQPSRTHPVKSQIICHIHKYLVNGIDMYVVLIYIFKVDFVNIRRIVDVKLHSGPCLDVVYTLGDFKDSAPARHPQFLHCRGNRKAYGLIGSLRVGYHKVGCERVKPSLGTLHRCIKGF